jgi:3-methyladenine DNA glycosylase AlkC
MEPFKNELSFAKALRIAERIAEVHPGFPSTRFRRGLARELEALELKDRMHLIATRIEAGLPAHPPESFAILVRTLAADAADTHGLRGFLVWPLTEIVARRGMKHFVSSMDALREMTRRFTAEFAIRPFIKQHPERVFKQLRAWCDHPDEHVRRLVSEGSRPLLPWGGNLPGLLEPPYPTLDLLEQLHLDPSPYVRLSVANHLNDFSKYHPARVIDTLERWRQANPGDANLEKLSRHACRTLLKAGHPQALAFHGYGDSQSPGLLKFELLAQAVKIGGRLDYHLVIRNGSKRAVKVMFDYAIHHLKANGAHSPKVFKGRARELAPGDSWEIQGSHSFKRITTRVYHPGLHRMEPRINGRIFPACDFLLKP